MIVKDAFFKTIEWTPTLVVGYVTGYYSLGVAYTWGVMAQLDRVAIIAFYHFFGYAGVGYCMTHFQPYAALGVRTVAAFLGSTGYAWIERLCKMTYARYFPPTPNQKK